MDKYDPDKNGVKSYEWATPWLLNECEEVYTEIVNILPSLKAHCNTYSINLFVGEALEDEDCSVENFYCKLSKPDTPTYIPCTWKAVESDVCQNAAANFINKYNLSISVAEMNALVGEGRFCGCEEKYEEKASSTYLSYIFGVEIISTDYIDGILFGTDIYGTLHIKLPKVDMQNSNNLTIFNQFLAVLSGYKKYYCKNPVSQTNPYKPIDWRDYFTNIRDISFSIVWHSCPVTLEYSTFVGSNYITHIFPSWEQFLPGNKYTFKFAFNGMNTPALQFVFPDNMSCLSEFESLIKDCP